MFDMRSRERGRCAGGAKGCAIVYNEMWPYVKPLFLAILQVCPI